MAFAHSLTHVLILYTNHLILERKHIFSSSNCLFALIFKSRKERVSLSSLFRSSLVLGFERLFVTAQKGLIAGLVNVGWFIRGPLSVDNILPMPGEIGNFVIFLEGTTFIVDLLKSVVFFNLFIL